MAAARLQRRADRLRLLVEAVDPKLVVALDSEARLDVVEATGKEMMLLAML